MVVASLVINASYLCILMLKCGRMKLGGITDKAFVLCGYSNWKDRSSDKQGIEYYNLLMSAAQLGTTGLCYWSTNQVIS